MFFFEKKNQKTFTYGARCRRAPHQQSKVFCFFFSKKKTPYFLNCPTSRTAPRDADVVIAA
jgi:hypothetical protein